MAVSWIPHRFSGGLLALDTTNTVVLRDDPARGFDRFDDPGEIAHFALAASGFRSAELGGRALHVRDPEKIAGTVIDIRERTDRLVRRAVREGGIDTADLPGFLSACAAGLANERTSVGLPGRPFGEPAAPIDFEAALAVSALSLLSVERLRRVRICASCGWLFVDASRNGSRIWCDMAVCGNRRKARRHYRRRTSSAKEHDHV